MAWPLKSRTWVLMPISTTRNFKSTSVPSRTETKNAHTAWSVGRSPITSISAGGWAHGPKMNTVRIHSAPSKGHNWKNKLPAFERKFKDSIRRSLNKTNNPCKTRCDYKCYVCNLKGSKMISTISPVTLAKQASRINELIMEIARCPKQTTTKINHWTATWTLTLALCLTRELGSIFHGQAISAWSRTSVHGAKCNLLPVRWEGHFGTYKCGVSVYVINNFLELKYTKNRVSTIDQITTSKWTHWPNPLVFVIKVFIR